MTQSLIVIASSSALELNPPSNIITTELSPLTLLNYFILPQPETPIRTNMLEYETLSDTDDDDEDEYGSVDIKKTIASQKKELKDIKKIAKENAAQLTKVNFENKQLKLSMKLLTELNKTNAAELAKFNAQLNSKMEIIINLCQSSGSQNTNDIVIKNDFVCPKWPISSDQELKSFNENLNSKDFRDQVVI